MAITGAAQAVSGGTKPGVSDPLGDAPLRAGQGKFNATGKIPCAQAPGQPMGQCGFGVARAGAGSAVVSVTMPDGRRRMIMFENGKATGADLSQADGDMSFSAKKGADLYMIRAGKERYDQIVEMARSFSGNKRVQGLVDKGRAAVDLSTDKARSVMSDGLSATSKKLRSVADNGDGPDD